MITKSEEIILLLSAPFLKNEMEQIQEKLRLCEAMKNDLHSVPPELFLKLNQNRLLASNTLLKSKTIEQELWDKANLFIANLIANNLSFTFNRVLQLNQIFTDTEVTRDHEIYSANVQYLELKFLKEGIELFEKFIFEKIDNMHPVIFAFRCYQWIVSLHPFTNGNGRTARLVADWILLKNGYLPISFPTSHSSHVSFTLGGERRSQLLNFNKFYEALSSSYSILSNN